VKFFEWWDGSLAENIRLCCCSRSRSGSGDF